MTLKFI